MAARKDIGFFIPNESSPNIKVLQTSVAGRSEPTPTESDRSKSALSPYLVPIGNGITFPLDQNLGDVSIELECNHGLTDVDNFPEDRPQVSDEIVNAINSGNMSIMTMNDTGLKGNNCDHGSNMMQMTTTSCGMYHDYNNLGSIMFNKNDLVIHGSSGNNEYQGKSRPPVHDFYDAIKFYHSDGITVHTTVLWPSIFSDGDHVYAIGGTISSVVGGLTGADIECFRFDPYKRIFISRGKVNESNGNICYYANNASNIFDPLLITYIPISPCLFRIKSDNNKLVAAYMAVINGDNDNAYIFVAQSFDDGLTWSEMVKIGYNGFFEHLKDNLPLQSFRLKAACNGCDIVIVWAADTSPTSADRQMRCIVSRDGGRKWNYNTSNSNMADMFLANESKNDTAAALTSGINMNVNFGLTVNSDNLFVIAKRGDGDTDDVAPNAIGGSQYLIFYCADNADIMGWKQRGKININTDYNANLDGYNQARSIESVELFSDPVHGWDYVVLKIYCSTPSAGFNADYGTAMVRYKFMPREEWTTCPDWTETGIAGERNADYLLIMEPPNRNTYIYAPSDSILDFVGIDISAAFHRGHILVMGSTDAPAHIYHYLIGMKAWTNVPINYSLRQSWLPVCGLMTSQGWNHVVNIGAVTDTLTRADNMHVFSIANGVYGAVFEDYYQLTGGGIGASSIVGIQEFVVRFVIKRGALEAGLSVNILEFEVPIWDSTLGMWRRYGFLAQLNGILGIKLCPYGDFATNVIDNIPNNIWYEYMVVVSAVNGAEFSLYRRLWNDTESSAVADQWTVLAGGSVIDYGAWPPAVGCSYINVGCRNASAGVYGSSTSWGYKGLWSSKSFTDITPRHMHYKSYPTSVIPTFDPTLPGVLSSEGQWKFDRYDIANNARKSGRGETISPMSIWMGNEWLVKCDSKYSKMGALLWLTMRENSSTYTKNIGLVNNDGSIHGGITTVNPFGLYFDGVNGYLSCGVDSRFSVTNNFSITAWIKPYDTNTTGYILSKTATGIVNSGYGLYFDGPNNRLSLIGGTITAHSSAAFTSDYDRWVFVVVVVKDNYAYFYRNGVFVSGGSIGVIPTNVADIRVGSCGAGSYFKGSMVKVGLFNRSLSNKEINDMFMEWSFGPHIPSDFFVRVYGDGCNCNDTWQVLAKNYGGSPDNVLDSIPGTRFCSSRDGKHGILPGGVNYNEGDVEVALCTENLDYIGGDSVLIMGCNATDVKVWGQDLDPYFWGWGGATDLGHYQLHNRDEYNSLPLDIFNGAGSIVNGVLTNSASEWREGAYVGQRLLLCPDTSYDHYGLAAAPEDNYIQKCIYNSASRLQLDSSNLNLTAVANLYVRMLSDRCLFKLGSSQHFKYWRFVFSNNATNGDLIEVGHINIGDLLLLDENTAMPSTITIVPEEKASGANIYSYGITKRIFEVSLNQVPRVGNNDIDKTLSACQQSIRLCNVVFYISGFYNDDNGTTLVHACILDSDLQLVQSTFPNVSLNIKLREV